MISTGNDIVALGSVNKQRTHEFRFYSKILSGTEQELYHQPEYAAISFENYVWLLWSVKESAYKHLKRSNPGLLFSPTKIIVTEIQIPANQITNYTELINWESTGSSDNFYLVKVIYGEEVLYAQSKITSDWIATVVNNTLDFEDVYWGVNKIDNPGYEYQSKLAKIFLLNKLNEFLGYGLFLDKADSGYPVIIKDNQHLNLPVSIAHDGYYVAYSFKLHQHQTVEL